MGKGALTLSVRRGVADDKGVAETGASAMESSFGVLDAFAFVVFAVLIIVGVIIVVSLGKLPGQLARKWGHPQAAAINVASWVGLAAGGLLWPLALIWAFMSPLRGEAASPRPTSGEETRP
jgi:ABC-type Mn2+/Zn2+ transport system permease subunit